MVAVIFLAILLWAGPIVVPDAVRRWTLCHAKSNRYQAEARSCLAFAAKPSPRMSPEDVARLRRRAET
jgi:hypothetical protein